MILLHFCDTKFTYIKYILLIKKGDDIIDIKVIGTNCSNGIKLHKMVKKAVEENDTNITVEEINDEKSKKRYGIQNIPGLVINDKLVSQGKVLTPREIAKLLV